MHKALNGKGYIKGGEGVFVTCAGEVYAYRDEELTPMTTINKTCGVIEMKYLGMFEMQPLYDGRKSFYGKAFVERWNTENGMRYVLKSYGTVVATVTPTYADDEVETYDIEVGVNHLSATTLRHVKEFLAQTADVFKGVTLPWLRKAIQDGRPIDGAGTMRREVYTLKEL